MKRVIVTGGAGFIGSNLTEELAGRGYHVTVLDNLSTGKIKNIAMLLKYDNVEFIKGSITNLPLLHKLFRDIDCIFHQAAIPSVSRSVEDPQASHQVNVTGTLNILLAARDNGIRKVIFASSSAVYGDTPTLPKMEDMLPKPKSPYAVTKLAGEYYCSVFHHVYTLPTVCLRYFNVYGPRQDPFSQYSAAIPKFIKIVSEKNPPIIFGDGEQTRDFTFVKDVVAANILAAESDASGIFNIGRGENTSVNRLAELIIHLIGNNVEPIYKEPRPGDVKHSLADISKAKTFGYSPKYSLEEGLRETIRGLKH